MYTNLSLLGTMNMANADIITFRAERDLTKDLAILQSYENLDRSSAARKAFELGINEWKKLEAIKLILDGKISLGKAAKMLNIHLYELITLLQEKKIDFISLTEEGIGREAAAAKG